MKKKNTKKQVNVYVRKIERVKTKKTETEVTYTKSKL